MLVPDDWDGPKRKEADAALSKYIADNGPKVLQAAISGGQYSHSDGLFYGGIQKSWSHRTFHQILIDHVSSDTENIAVLDLHTGLGPTGYGEPIYLATSSETFDLAKSWYGPSVTSPAKGDSKCTNHLYRAGVWNGSSDGGTYGPACGQLVACRGGPAKPASSID